QGNGALRRAQITWRDGFGHRVSRAGMNDVPEFRLADSVLNARHFQIECVVAGERQQVKPEALQGIERCGRGEKSPALMDRLTLFRDRGFQIREDDVALQE